MAVHVWWEKWNLLDAVHVGSMLVWVCYLNMYIVTMIVHNYKSFLFAYFCAGSDHVVRYYLNGATDAIQVIPLYSHSQWSHHSYVSLLSSLKLETPCLRSGCAEIWIYVYMYIGDFLLQGLRTQRDTRLPLLLLYPNQAKLGKSVNEISMRTSSLTLVSTFPDSPP